MNANRSRAAFSTALAPSSDCSADLRICQRWVKQHNSLSIEYVLCSLLEQTFVFLPELARMYGPAVRRKMMVAD